MNSLNEALVELDNVKAKLDKIISNVKDATILVERFGNLQTQQYRKFANAKNIAEEAKNERRRRFEKTEQRIAENELGESEDLNLSVEDAVKDAVEDNAPYVIDDAGNVVGDNASGNNASITYGGVGVPKPRNAQEQLWTPIKPPPPLQRTNVQSSSAPKIVKRDESSIIPLLVEEDPQNNQDKSDLTPRDTFDIQHRDEIRNFINTGGTSKKTAKKKKSKNTIPKRLTLNKKKSSDYIISHSCYEGKQSIYPNNGTLPIISYNEPKCESYIITIPEKKLGGEVDTGPNELSNEYKKYLKDKFSNYNRIENRYHE